MSQQSNKIANLTCGILLCLFFVYMSNTSYREYKAKKEIPQKIKQLQEQVERLSDALKNDTPPFINTQPVELPHPSRTISQIPIVQEFDNYSMASGCVVTWSNYGSD